MSSKSLDDLQPIVREQAKTFLSLASARGVALKMTQTLRTWAEQEALYAQGRSKPGKVVTKAPAGASLHNYGLAFDVAFQGNDPYLAGMEKVNPNGFAAIWEKIGKIGEECGLKWGGRWEKFPDRPHFETASISLAVAKLRWPRGWTRSFGAEAPDKNASIPGPDPVKADSSRKSSKVGPKDVEKTR